MRALHLAPLLAAALALPSSAVAQTSTYICTPDGQVLRQQVDSTGAPAGTTLWYTGNKKEGFNDCVVGPDGWLYIASGASIIRISLSTATPTGAAPILSLVGSAARGLAFNVTTLYVMTETTGVYTLNGVPGMADPLAFPDAATPLAAIGLATGYGIAFDIFGNLVGTSGNSLQRATVNLTAPFYTNAASALLTRAQALFGVAVNTCGETVYADRFSRSLRVVSKDGTSERTLASFPDAADYPVAVEIDSNNTTYVVTVQSDAGTSAKLWRIAGNLSNSCASASPTLVVDLNTLLSGMTKLKGLSSSRALGVAVAPTDASLTRTYTPAQCDHLFDFGYHTARLSFADCSTPFTVTVDALETRPTEVVFGGALGSEHAAVRYSPMGGHAVQYVLRGGPAQPFTFESQFGFYAQETLARPGVARAVEDGRTFPYTESVMTDFWDVGIHDAAAGTRGDDFSKRVVFTAPAPPHLADCQITLADWEEPFNTQNPLFKSGQTIKIAFTATSSTGAPCGGGGTMRISVARILPAPVTLYFAQSAGAAQTDNIMSNQGDKYWFNLNTSGLGTGDFLLTVSGSAVAPTSRTFSIGQ